MGETRRCLVALMFAIGCAASARAGTLRGMVLAEDGNPASGARVWAAKVWFHSLERVEATADDHGRFTFDLGPGHWVIQANLGDEGIASMEGVEVMERGAVGPVTLRLTGQGRLRGRLFEAETGKPIAAGRLVLDNGLDPVTDRDGRFEVGGLSRTRYHESFVVAPGRERIRVQFEISEKPTTDLDIAVPRGGKAIGRVLDSDGKAISGAFVGRTTSGSVFSMTGLWVRADDQGRFVFDGLPLDRTTWLSARAEGYENAERGAGRYDSESGPLSLEFRLRRKPGASGGAVPKPAAAKVANRRDVSGAVLDPDSNPVVGASVLWGWNLSDDTIETTTDSNGRFRLAFVPDAPGVVNVIPPKSDLAAQTTRVQDRGDQAVTITLPKGHTAAGVLRDDQGTKFAGVTVLPILFGAGRQSLALWQRSTKTDRAGRFTVAGLPASGTMFTFLGDGVTDLRDHALELDKENVVITSAAGAIRGKVLSAQGKPVRNFRVLLNDCRDRKSGDKHGGYFAGFGAPGLTYSADDGAFLIRNLAASSVQRVTVRAAGHGERSIDRVIAQSINLLTARTPLAFQLSPAHILRARVVENTSARPVPSARVSLVDDDPNVNQNTVWNYTWGNAVHARTDARGVATFSPLEFGEGTILVQAAGFARRNLDWRDGAEERTVTLEPEAVVSGALFDGLTGKPLEGVSVELYARFGGGFSTVVEAGDAGRFRIGEIPAGDYRLLITTKDGSQLHQEQLTLQPGESATRVPRLSSPAAGSR